MVENNFSLYYLALDVISWKPRIFPRRNGTNSGEDPVTLLVPKHLQHFNMFKFTPWLLQNMPVVGNNDRVCGHQESWVGYGDGRVLDEPGVDIKSLSIAGL